MKIEREKEPEMTNKMGTEKISSLIFNMSWPPFCSMMMAYSYNLIDSMFVSWAGQDKLAAVSLAFPLQTFIVACAVGFGVGINVLVARHLGEKNQRAADEAATNGLVVAALIGIIINIVLLVLLRPYFSLYVEDSQMTVICMQYMNICVFMAVPTMLQIAIQKILQGTGNMIAPMLLQISGVILNFGLDPALIFGWGIFPELGVSGAAVATVFGYTFSALLSFYVLLCRKQKVKIRFNGYKLDIKQTKETLAIGFPSFLMNVLGSVMLIVTNAFLVGFSLIAVSFFGAYFKVQQIVERAVNSLVQGILPIMSYSYGARYTERLKETFKKGIVYAVVIMGIGTLFILLFPEMILDIFKAEAAMKEIGITGMRIMVLGYVFAGISIIIATYMQAVKKIKQSIIINLLRQAGVLIPLMLILSHAVGMIGIWIAFPVSEIITCLYGLVAYRKERAKSEEY